MKWIIKYCLICTSLCGIFSTESYSVDDIFNTPNSLIEEGNWQEARIELERIWFFSSDKKIKSEALIRKAECFKYDAEFDKMLETLNRIFLFKQDDSIVFRVKYQKALGHYLNDAPGMAIAELQSLINLNADDEQQLKMNFISSLCYIDLQQWSNAKNSAKEYIRGACEGSGTDILLLSKIDSLFDKKNIPKYLSPKKAKNISTVIPGSGQIYAGKVGEGIFSFTLHAGLLYFGVDQFLNKFYFTGYTAGFGLLQRIHSGNLQRVQNLVNERNEEVHTGFLKRFLGILEEAST